MTTVGFDPSAPIWLQPRRRMIVAGFSARRSSWS
jgi:hypothetical protein